MFKFKLNDTAYILDGKAIYSAKVKEISYTEDVDWIYKCYKLKISYPKGLFDTTYITKTLPGESIFLDKEEAKAKVEEIKNAEKIVNVNYRNTLFWNSIFK